jgi:hypothetical protein
MVHAFLALLWWSRLSRHCLALACSDFAHFAFPNKDKDRLVDYLIDFD